ncbi:MAG TPA: hypothetical protein VJ276_25350, partial [Thermoanaerobaculia bacterium]|nr:hypothetical protein [Thermoanaerobaculia bacterium]
MAIIPWVGPHRIAIVPVFDRRLDPEPAPDWDYQVRSRVFYDPDPVTGLDRSFQHYLQALSYGRASIDGDVFPMVWSDGPEVNIPAIQSLPKGHGYTHLLAVLPHDFGNDRGGHAFVDVAAVNGITSWARVAMFSDRALFTRQPLGIWMQELLHMETRLLSHPNLGSYDPMNGPGAMASTHASAHTKSLMGWVSESSILDHADGTVDVRLHAIALLQPPPPDRVTAVRVPSQQSRSSFMIEARVAVDQYERRDGPNDGLPPGPGSAMAKDGVIVYEVAGPETVDLRSGLALAAGEEFVTSDGLRIAVREAIPGGFGVSIKTAFRRLINRSGAFGTPPASGAPTAVVIDALGVHNIVYRDTSGRLHELWRDAAGRTGTTNLTSIAPGAPNASGNPFSYVDTTAVLELVLYRGSDGHVHSLYWSTGAVGHDQLSTAAGAPKAAGNPAGYFTPATNIHHVLYRTGDGHLHALFWSGTGAVGHSDATALAGAPPAAGDPAPFVDTARGDNIVVFRGTD